MSIRETFQNMYNKRRVHIEQLRVLRNQKDISADARRKLDKKIEYEQQQLSVIDDIWDLAI